MSSNKTVESETKLSNFCNSPYAVLTDSCTHAIELCLRYLNIKKCHLTAYTYLSVPQTLNLLDIDFELTDEQWKDEYCFHGTNVWDSARCLRPNMYRPGQFQCLSFGIGKPLDNVRGGAILCDNLQDYRMLKQMSYDGRDPEIEQWTLQSEYTQGFHYMLRWEEIESLLKKLNEYIDKGVYEHRYKPYHDCRKIKIKK